MHRGAVRRGYVKCEQSRGARGIFNLRSEWRLVRQNVLIKHDFTSLLLNGEAHSMFFNSTGMIVCAYVYTVAAHS